MISPAGREARKKPIFSKEFGEEALNRLVRQIPQSQRLMIRDVSRNSGTLLAQEIKCLGIKTSISAGIQSKFADGYFLINTDEEALDAFGLLSEKEGIIPALESAHAIAQIVKMAPELDRSSIIVVNLSGRGDKDVQSVINMKEGVEQ